jgi:imidazolonepropionase-like amidohydrolase
MGRVGSAAIILGLSVGGAEPAAGQADPITIFAGRVIDGKGGSVKNATVVVDQGRILRIEPRRVDRPTFEFPGGTLLPGLIDGHVHLTAYLNQNGRMHTRDDGDTPAQSALAAAANAHRMLLAGFTTVASIGAGEDADLRDWIGRGDIPGPRILTSLEPITDAALTPEQLRAEVQARIRAGANLIKLFASKSIREGGTQTMSEEQLRAACEEATAGNVPAIVHAHSASSILAAAAAGCRQVEHGVFVDRPALEAMAKQGVYFDPQCSVIFRNYLDNRRWFQGIGNFTDEGFAAMERAIPLALAGIRAAAATPGLKLAYGTDVVAGAHGRNAEDLVCRVRQAGLRPMDVLVSATGGNAAALGISREAGTVTAGLAADLIVVAGNPLDDIGAMTRVVFVMRGGLVYRHDPTLAGNRALR